MSCIIDDRRVTGDKIEIVKPIGAPRIITHVIHDIDGTHSLIRQWHPVMSLSMHWAMTCGLTEDFDSDENLRKLIARVGSEPLPETDRICHENAGFSAITQLEYGVRRGIELRHIPEGLLELTEDDHAKNSEVIRRIRDGEERFPDIKEKKELLQFIDEVCPRLFKLYEKILNGACRDKNTADAWQHPERWRVPGSLEFIRYLFDCGCVNYFVTGAVIFDDGGMREEVEACGYEVGPGKMIKSLKGSSWKEKLPKDEVMQRLFRDENIAPEHALIVGDGRTEIKAGADMGCVTITRLPKDETRLREIHTDMGANYIFEDYTDPAIMKLIQKESTS